jgi:hypothetical protein
MFAILCGGLVWSHFAQQFVSPSDAVLVAEVAFDTWDAAWNAARFNVGLSLTADWSVVNLAHHGF